MLLNIQWLLSFIFHVSYYFICCAWHLKVKYKTVKQTRGWCIIYSNRLFGGQFSASDCISKHQVWNTDWIQIREKCKHRSCISIIGCNFNTICSAWYYKTRDICSNLNIQTCFSSIFEGCWNKLMEFLYTPTFYVLVQIEENTRALESLGHTFGGSASSLESLGARSSEGAVVEGKKKEPDERRRQGARRAMLQWVTNALPK